MTENTFQMLSVQIGLESLFTHGFLFFLSLFPTKKVVAMGTKVGNNSFFYNLLSVEMFLLQRNAFWPKNCFHPWGHCLS